MRILIADPHNQVLRALHSLIIEKTDHRVLGEAFNLESLLLQVQEKQPDLVLLDWDLPGLTGAKLNKFASAWDHSPRLIVMSSKTDIEEAAIESGADAGAGRRFGDRAADARPRAGGPRCCRTGRPGRKRGVDPEQGRPNAV